jgi:N-acyl-D-aspartate/D-glutamate deacylase
MADVPCPAGAEPRDMAGAVVLPGFIDVHAHWAGGGDLFVEQSWEFLVNLAFGVTTLHNPSADTAYARSSPSFIYSLLIFILLLLLFFFIIIIFNIY